MAKGQSVRCLDTLQFCNNRENLDESPYPAPALGQPNRKEIDRPLFDRWLAGQSVPLGAILCTARIAELARCHFRSAWSTSLALKFSAIVFRMDGPSRLILCALWDDTVEDGVGECRFADNAVPFVDGQLAGDQDGGVLVSVLDDFHEVASLIGAEAVGSPIVEDEEIRLGERTEQVKLSRGASFHAAVEKPSIASGQPFQSWTA